MLVLSQGGEKEDGLSFKALGLKLQQIFWIVGDILMNLLNYNMKVFWQVKKVQKEQLRTI